MDRTIDVLELQSVRSAMKLMQNMTAGLELQRR